MTTEEGIERVRRVRIHVEALRNRLEFLEERMEARVLQGKENANGYDQEEADAIRWALPVLEAEWDNIVRIRKNIERVKSRLSSLERRGVEEDPGGKPPRWDLSVASGGH